MLHQFCSYLKHNNMKNVILLLFFLYVLKAQAQHETLFDDLNVLGAFGGPILEISSINGEVGADVGGGGALIVNNFFLGGYGMGTDYPETTIGNLDYNIKFRHGGLWLGYTYRDFKVAHLFSSVKIGWGKAQLRRNGDAAFSDRLFALTPELGVELNITSFFKIGLTGGYRWVNGISRLPELENEDFSSPTGIITFRFGGFGGWDNDGDWDWDWD